MEREERPLPQSPEAARATRALGQAIRNARVARKLRRVDLARRAGLSETTLGRLERGDATVAIGRVLELLTALGPELANSVVALVEADPVGERLRKLGQSKRVRRDEF